MKRITITIGIIFMCIFSYTNATNSLEFDDAIFGGYFSGSQNNQTQLHFNYGGQNFAGTILWKDMIDVTATITFSGGEVKTCSKKLRGLYYNNKRGERVWPLDEYSLDALQDLDSSYDGLEITGGLYTMCDGTGLEIYGNVTHTRNNSSYTLLAGIGYDFLTNTYTTSFSGSMYFQGANSYGYFFDTYGGIADVSGIGLTISDIFTESPDTEHSNGGGGGIKLYKDDCLDGDYSPSYYDGLCGTYKEETHGSANLIGNITNSPYSNELNNAYQRAYSHGITTMPTIQQANIEGTLIRKDMAKMITNFAINILGKDISTGNTCEFSDTNSLSKEMQRYAMAACRLGLMGYENDGVTVKKNFDPETEVDRAQFGTILSRLLRTNKYDNGIPYYKDHLQALKKEAIMKIIENPLVNEQRGRVMLMLMRVFNK